MRTLPHPLRQHPRAAGLGLAAWLALWVLTIATWLYDEAGRSAGMHPLPNLAHMAAPMLIGALVGWWTRPRTAGLAGLGFAALNFAALLAWSALLIALDRVQPGPDSLPAWSGVGEALGMGVVYLIWAGVWGLAGGLLAALARRFIR